MKTKDDNIHKKHRERMRNKALNYGFKHFDNHELLEFVLFYGLPRVNTNPIAHNLLNSFDNFLGVLTADRKDLKSINGIGDEAMLFIKSLCELYSRALLETRKMIRLNSKLALREYAISLFKFCTTEKVYAICLDKNMFHIGSLEIEKEGSASEAKVDIAEAVIKILTKRPKYVVLAHNHLDDNLSISNDDGIFTTNLFKRLIEYNVEVCDHVIVSLDNFTSFDEQGLMERVKKLALGNLAPGNVNKSEQKVSSSFIEFDPDFDKFK